MIGLASLCRGQWQAERRVEASHADLAEITNIDRRHIRRATRKLQAGGLVRIETVRGRHGITIYVLLESPNLATRESPNRVSARVSEMTPNRVSAESPNRVSEVTPDRATDSRESREEEQRGDRGGRSRAREPEASPDDGNSAEEQDHDDRRQRRRRQGVEEFRPGDAEYQFYVDRGLDPEHS
jgi:hypothetical protein